MFAVHGDNKHRQVWPLEGEVWGWILFSSFGSADDGGSVIFKSLPNDILKPSHVGVHQARALEEQTGKATGVLGCPRCTGSLKIPLSQAPLFV